MASDIEFKDVQISQLESRLRKYDRDFISGNLKIRESSTMNNTIEKVTDHSRNASRDTMLESDALRQERLTYELKVKIKEQEIYISRLQRQLHKNVEALKSTPSKFYY